MHAKDCHHPNDRIISTATVGSLLMPAAIVACIILIVIPVGPAILDTLVVTNTAAALIILLLSVTASGAMQLSTFPSLILLGTLARLGTTIAATRLILTRGEAGSLIEILGLKLTGGNLAAGITLFAVIQIVQFLVIAKGAERVAEVTARFTLDALPGKQMSIDADLRNGLISGEEAAGQRLRLARESRFHGAMDGALKFIKGETIAVAVVTLVNIIGGVAAGVFSRGLDFSRAMRIYATLAVGEGLSAQLPALMICLTAGFLVTRGEVGKKPESLGATTVQQLTRAPWILFGIGTLVAVMASLAPVSGALFGIAAILLLSGGALIKLKRQEHNAARITAAFNTMDTNEAGISPYAPLALVVGHELYSQMRDEERWREFFADIVPTLLDKLRRTTGVLLPEVALTLANLPEYRYRVAVFGIPVADGFLAPRHVIAPLREMDHAKATAIPGWRETRTVYGTPIALIERRHTQTLRAGGIPIEEPEVRLLKHLGRAITDHAADFIGIQEIRGILNRTEKEYPELVREVMPRMVSLARLTDIMRRLVEENIPVGDFRLILETIALNPPEGKDIVTAVENIRAGLKRVITNRFAPDKHLRALLLDPALEAEISAHIKTRDEEAYLTLAPERIRSISESVATSVRQHGGKVGIVILTDATLRRYVRKIIETEMPRLPVLSYQELEADTVIDRRDTVAIATKEALS